MKKLGIAIIFLAVALCAHAQDVMTKLNSEIVLPKTLKADFGTIQFKTHDFLGGMEMLPASPGSLMSQEVMEARRMATMPITETIPILRFEDAELFEIPDITLGMKYREYKDMYRARDYVRYEDDPYDPLVAGVASFLLPGLGQMLSQEYGRGSAYMGMWASSVILMWSGIKVLDSEHIFWKWNRSEFWHSSKSSNKDGKGDDDDDKKRDKADIAGAIMVVTGAIAGIASRALAAVDAVKVAKIKNTYNRDMHRMQTYSYKFSPTIVTVRTDHGRVKTLGAEFTLKF